MLVNDEDLMSTGSLSVTVNPPCRETSHLVVVTFGVQRSDGGGCEERGNVTQSLSSGESATFSTDITLRPDEVYFIWRSTRACAVCLHIHVARGEMVCALHVRITYICMRMRIVGVN